MFTCDKCGMKINAKNDAWVEWYTEADTGLNTGFRIVHHNTGKCQYPISFDTSDGPLENFSGQDGLVRLLEQFSNRLKNPRELIDLILRIHIQNVELARNFWDRAREDGVIYEENEYYLSSANYTQETLHHIIARYST